jgi:hypothetical protein
MIWYAKKIILIHPPRTGGSSFETLLRRNAVKDNWKKRLFFNFYDRFKFESHFFIGLKHITCSQIKNIVGEAYYADALKIAFLRNPYDRVISHYNYEPYRRINALSGKSLKYFLENYKPMSFEYGESLSDYYDDAVDHFIRFENYMEDVLSICEKSNLEPLIRHEAKTQRRSEWKSYFDAETLEMVNVRFAEDFDRFGYKKIEG